MTTTTATPARKRITGDDRARLRAELADQYKAGVSLRTLAEQTGRSYGFVHRLLTEDTGDGTAAVDIRSRGGDHRPKKAKD